MSEGTIELRPSGWETWSGCPGAPRAQLGLPDELSIYADTGTAAHAVLEYCVKMIYGETGSLTTPTKASEMLGKEINVADPEEEPRLIVVDSEMCEHVQSVLDYIAKRYTEMGMFGPVSVRSESKVRPALEGIDALRKGTADVILVSDFELEIVDLKYGSGVVVELGTHEKPNGQLGIYLLGALSDYTTAIPKFSNVRMTIAQPRVWHRDGPIRSLIFHSTEALSCLT